MEDGDGAHRASGAFPVLHPGGRGIPDLDIVILTLAVSPVFLAVVVRTALRGEVFGAGPTICGGLATLSFAMALSAWRNRS